MKQIYLHIGFSKTGSSSLQSWLSLNSDNLREMGYDYADLIPSAKDGVVTPGNGVNLYHAANEKNWAEVESLLLNVYFNSNKKSIISSEALQGLDTEAIRKIKEICIKNNINITVIAYVRSAYELLYSNYLQGIKRHGFTLPFGKQEKIQYSVQRRFLENYLSCFGEDLVVLNYDNNKNNIFESFGNQIDIDWKKLELKTKRVNRSLTFPEATVLRDMNGIHSGVFSTEISDFLLELDPHKSTSVYYDEQLIKEAIQNCHEDITWINNSFFSDPSESLKVHYFTKGSKYSNENRLEIVEVLEQIVNWALKYEPRTKRKEFVDFLLGFAAFLEDERPEFSFSLIHRANLLRPTGQIIQKKLQSIGDKIGVEVQFRPPGSVALFNESNYDKCKAIHKSFISFMKQPFHMLDEKGAFLDRSILSTRYQNIYPLAMLIDAAVNREVQFISPFTGNLVTSATSVGINEFKFYDGEHCFFVGTNVSPKMQHSQGFLNVYLPLERIVFSIDYRDTILDFPVDKTRRTQLLLNNFDNILGKVDYEDVTNCDKSLIANYGIGHIGHSLWQDVSIFGDLLDLGMLASKKNIELGYCSNFFTSAGVSSDDIIKYPHKAFASSDAAFSFAKQHNALPIFLSHNFITQDLAEKLSNSLTEKSFIKSKVVQKLPNQKFVVLSLRLGTIRSCINLVELYIALIQKFANMKDIVFYIDGMNAGHSNFIKDFSEIAKLDHSLEQEKEGAKRIVDSSSNFDVRTIVGCSLNESLYVTKHADAIISPWGAGLVKYKWLCNKDTFIFGNALAMSEKHLHKRLYDNKLFRENIINSEYYDGGSSNKNGQHGRDCDYSLSTNDFLNQSFQFISKKLVGR